MKTSATNKKVREIIAMVKEGKLIHRPEFQRRLVWSRDDKNFFLDSILRGFPFPEIYLADGEVNLVTGDGTQLLVDGLQRVNTIVQYFEGDPELKLTTTPDYRTLSDDDKKAFLQYDIAVRDLGAVSKDEIIEAFKRLNATKYSLLDIEVSNAVYAGTLKKFSEKVAENEFFKRHNTFTASDYKRMGDLRYVLTIIGTMLSGYFNRDDAFDVLLDSYNDDFPVQVEIENRLNNTLMFIDECGFSDHSRVWKKADLFTLIIELDQSLHIKNISLQPSEVVDVLAKFYNDADAGNVDGNDAVSIYYKAALQASNDRINRVRRGVIIEKLLEKLNREDIVGVLTQQTLI